MHFRCAFLFVLFNSDILFAPARHECNNCTALEHTHTHEMFVVSCFALKWFFCCCVLRGLLLFIRSHKPLQPPASAPYPLVRPQRSFHFAALCNQSLWNVLAITSWHRKCSNWSKYLQLPYVLTARTHIIYMDVCMCESAYVLLYEQVPSTRLQYNNFSSVALTSLHSIFLDRYLPDIIQIIRSLDMYRNFYSNFSRRNEARGGMKRRWVDFRVSCIFAIMIVDHGKIFWLCIQFYACVDVGICEKWIRWPCKASSFCCSRAAVQFHILVECIGFCVCMRNNIQKP